MKIFLSHSAHYKPLLRELRTKLPEHINSWIDEDKLLLGDDLSQTFESAISEDVDFLILFIDERAARSTWVKREIEWALARERALGRTFLLPVVLDKRAWETFEPGELKKRKYLICDDFTEASIGFLAQSLSGELFAWLSRDMERAKIDKQESDERPDILNDADKFLHSIASEIRTIVHPYREGNPLGVVELLERMRSLDTIASLTVDQFIDLLSRMQRESLLAGLCFDGDEIFVEEEYYAWKINAFAGAKEKIARAACRMIKSNFLITLDAGSTTELIAKKIARSIILGRIRNLTVITNSLPAASDLLAASGQLGMEDHDQVLRVFISGGRVRPNTLAVVAPLGE